MRREYSDMKVKEAMKELKRQLEPVVIKERIGDMVVEYGVQGLYRVKSIYDRKEVIRVMNWLNYSSGNRMAVPGIPMPIIEAMAKKYIDDQRINNAIKEWSNNKSIWSGVINK